MPKLFTLPVHSCTRGDLTVFEGLMPGDYQRIFYITNADGSTRGGHRHEKAWQTLICIQGTCDIYVETVDTKLVFTLDEPNKALVLEPEDWHILENFSDNAIVLVVANQKYDPKDYIFESYSEKQILLESQRYSWER